MNLRHETVLTKFVDDTQPVNGMKLHFTVDETAIDYDTLQWEARLPLTSWDTGEVDEDGNTIRAEWFPLETETSPELDLSSATAFQFNLIYRCVATRSNGQSFTSKEVRLNYGLNN